MAASFLEGHPRVTSQNAGSWNCRARPVKSYIQKGHSSTSGAFHQSHQSQPTLCQGISGASREWAPALGSSKATLQQSCRGKGVSTAASSENMVCHPNTPFSGLN